MAYQNNPNSSIKYADVTPSDSVDLPDGVCRGIIITAAGTVSMVGVDNVAVTFTLQAGIVYPIGCKRVNATNTTATGIKALY